MLFSILFYLFNIGEFSLFKLYYYFVGLLLSLVVAIESLILFILLFPVNFLLGELGKEFSLGKLSNLLWLLKLDLFLPKGEFYIATLIFLF